MLLHLHMTRAASLAAAVAIAVPALAQQTYVLTDIAPRLSMDIYNCPGISINASGKIVGYTQTLSGTLFPYEWTPNSLNSAAGTYSVMTTPTGASSAIATGVNGYGQVCGSATTVVTTKKGNKVTQTSTTQAVVWNPSGSPSYLLNGGNRFVGQPTGINDSGEVVGDFGLWANGTVFSLPGAGAHGINNQGQVVGEYGSTNGGYLWSPTNLDGTTGTMITLPFFACRISDQSQAVGDPLGGGWQAESYTPSGGVVSVVPSGTSNVFGATGVNNSGEVVGGGTPIGAFLWDATNGFRSLNNPALFPVVGGSGWNLIWANAINDSGQIVGWGLNPAGAQCFFLLTPQ